MALTASTMLALGSPAPDFSLPATDGHTLSFADIQGERGTVVLFICNHCPYVIHISAALAELARAYMAKGIGFVGINSNDTAAYPADDFAHMQREKSLRGYPFAYLLDDTQAVAQAYSAACTPDIYVFDSTRKLAYRGQFDNTRPHRISSGNYDSSAHPAHGEDLKQALDTLLRGEQPSAEQVPSIGCNIKWKPGHEPEYFG